MEENLVCFMCARCKQLVKLDSSFDCIDNKTVQDLASSSIALSSSHKKSFANELVSASEPAKNVTQVDSNPQNLNDEDVSTPDKDVGKSCVESVGDDNQLTLTSLDHESSTSFTFVDDSGGHSMDNLSHNLKMIVRLFDLMSGNSELEHPLCEECTESLLEKLDKEHQQYEEEFNLYKKYCENLEAKETDIDTINKLKEEKEKLQKEEKDLLDQLKATEEEREQVKKEILNAERHQEILKEEEKKHLQEYADLRLQQLELDEERCSANKQLKHTEAMLSKLRKTNVFNSTFHIWHQGPFGTINGFRLGRLPGIHVEWTEINAAWGQVVLLLSSLSKKMGLKFKRYKLVPFGNHSYVEPLEDKSKELPLYGSGGIRFLWDTKFDHAMVAFLDCLQQFKEAVEGNGFSLPYKMSKGKIEDTGGTGASFSIKMQFNSEEQWTKALKFMLTNLKWGLAWVSSQFVAPS